LGASGSKTVIISRRRLSVGQLQMSIRHCSIYSSSKPLSR